LTAAAVAWPLAGAATVPPVRHLVVDPTDARFDMLDRTPRMAHEVDGPPCARPTPPHPSSLPCSYRPCRYRSHA